MGETVDVFGAGARVFGERENDDRGFRAAGLELPLASVRNAAAAGPHTFSLVFPGEIQRDLQVDHVYLSFAERGPGPAELYDAPHVAIYFHFIDPTARATITCPEARVSEDRLPPDFIVPSVEARPIGSCVPAAGLHAFNQTAPEFTGRSFASALAHVYHAGALVAWGPMLTDEVLLRGDRVELPILHPDAPLPLRRAPRAFTAELDPVTAAYRLRLEDFQDR